MYYNDSMVEMSSNMRRERENNLLLENTTNRNEETSLSANALHLERHAELRLDILKCTYHAVL